LAGWRNDSRRARKSSTRSACECPDHTLDAYEQGGFRIARDDEFSNAPLIEAGISADMSRFRNNRSCNVPPRAASKQRQPEARIHD